MPLISKDIRQRNLQAKLSAFPDFVKKKKKNTVLEIGWFGFKGKYMSGMASI